MLAIYVQAPAEVAQTCATVDPTRNVAEWYRRGTNGSWRVGWSTYRDNGESIDYARNVPHVVEILVEHKTGRRIRFGCN